MDDEIKNLRDQIEYYKENDNQYIYDTSKSGEKIRKFINYEEHLMKILYLEVESYAKVFEAEDDEKNLITYVLFEIYSLIRYPRLLSFDKFMKYLEDNRKLIERKDSLMARIAMCYKLLDSNRIIDKKDLSSFLSEGYKNFADHDKQSDIYIELPSKEEILKIVEEDDIIDEIDKVLRYLIFDENKNNIVKKEKLNLKPLKEGEEEKALML